MIYNRITGHHTGGSYTPNHIDLAAYPLCIDGDGQTHQGRLPLDANAAGKPLTKGSYYPHTWKLNSGNLGIAICCMGGGVWGDPRASRFFPLQRQVDAFIAEIARRCRQFEIEPTRRTVLTHAEVQPTLGVTQKQKWDFDYQILKTAGRDPVAIGDEIRQEVAKLLRGHTFTPAMHGRPDLSQGSQGPDVEALQGALRLKADGIFGPKTMAAVIALQKSRNLLPDGVVSRMTWAALGL